MVILYRIVRTFMRLLAAGLLIVLVSGAVDATLFSSGQPSAAGSLVTRWASQVTPDHVLPEYPRPDLVRQQWLNLNGPWEYAIRDRGADPPEAFDGTTLVPFPVQSRLSGVARPVSDSQELWYRRKVRLPLVPAARWLLHFGAVDWEATVWVNGQKIGTHHGGYDPFTFDVTSAFRAGSDQELMVADW